jgi:hypothetical protein
MFRKYVTWRATGRDASCAAALARSHGASVVPFSGVTSAPSRPATAGEKEKDMDEQTFQTKFNELLEKIKELPEDQRGRLERLVRETRERRQRIQASVSELQESLDYLRLSVKYLVFDLEATRRENAYLRRLVEQSNREPDRRTDHHDDDNFLEDDAA